MVHTQVLSVQDPDHPRPNPIVHSQQWQAQEYEDHTSFKAAPQAQWKATPWDQDLPKGEVKVNPAVGIHFLQPLGNAQRISRSARDMRAVIPNLSPS